MPDPFSDPDTGPARTLRTAQGRELAYRLAEGRTPGIVFFGGFRSDMSGGKAMHLDTWCRQRGQRYLRMDYSGHGCSSGRFEDGSVGDWLDDAEAMLAHAGEAPWIFVGSSMGAWIALLLALRRPRDCRGLLTLAAATDFTERLLWSQLEPAQRERLEREGGLALWSDYEQDFFRVGRRLFEDGRRHLLLDAEIGLDCPVRLIHGLADADVPWRFSLDTAERLRSADVRLTLVKGADHRLSEPAELDLLTGTLAELLDGLG